MNEGPAIVHDYLIQMGGAERVVACMAAAHPDSPIHAGLVDEASLLPEFRGRDLRTTWLQRVPGAVRHFKKLFPLYPMAFANLKVQRRQLAWISASTFAKCVALPPGMPSVLYCHAPTRFLWDTEHYVNQEVASAGVRRMIRMMLPWLRRIDRAAAGRMTVIVANSMNVRERVKRCYGREAEVIPPPVEVERFQVCPEHSGGYLVLSRLIGYKNVELAVRAFAGSGRRLRIIGEGTDRARLESFAGPEVTFLGKVGDDVVRRELAAARALIFPGEEDFGIAPVEAMACGKPVVAFGRGGALETVRDGVSGIFFHEPNVESLRAALEVVERVAWNPAAIRKEAEQFSSARFLTAMQTVMERTVRLSS